VSVDLTVTNRYGSSHGYVIAEGEQNPVIHTANAPNVPLPGGGSSPTQAGGLYDVRDSEGDKAIAHFDWKLGAGQKSLDSSDANASKFLESKNIEIGRNGQFSLLHGMTKTELATTCGPVFSGAGILWMGRDTGTLWYSIDEGTTWTQATITATPAINASIDDITTDGTVTYFCVSSGANKGIWKNTSGSPYSFAKYGASPTTEAITDLACMGGYIYAATAAGAGTIASTGAYTQRTPVLLSSMTSVALVAGSSAVYWAATQNGRSFVYKLYYDPNSVTYYTEQYMEMPSGFIATCATCYLSMLYVGGYWQTAASAVGKGSVYVCADGYASPLFDLGTQPEETAVPGAVENDNRIYALCATGKDLYVLSNRACYRWDIDETGYSHVFDHPGCGVATTSLVWKTDSLLSWDGSNLHVDGTHEEFYPLGWTVVDDHVADWTFTGAEPYSAQYTGISQVWTAVPPTAGNKDAALSNTAGTSMQFDTTSNHAGNIDVSIRDGVREARVRIGPDNVYLYQYTTTTVQEAYLIYERLPDTSHTHTRWINSSAPPYGYWETYTDYDWGYVTHYRTLASGRSIWSDETPIAGDTIVNSTLSSGCSREKSVLITLKLNVVTVSLDGGATVALTTSLSKPDTSANRVQVTFSTGATVDSMVFNASTSTTVSGSTTFRPSLASHKGKLVAPYNDRTPTVPVVGQLVTSPTFATEGSITQSPTNFHSGSVKKDFRAISVSHDILPAGTGVTAQWKIDGVLATASGQALSSTETRFPINSQGFSIENITLLTSDGTATPTVRSVNVLWDFVKTKKHQYLLDCRQQASGGRWSEDSEEAISFLFTTANESATFTDRFVGSYAGTIEDVQFTQANYSPREGYGGLVRVTVRESA
jgi:hypothetical protein